MDLKTMAEAEYDKCMEDLVDSDQHYQSLPKIVSELVSTCHGGHCHDHISPVPLPSRQAMVKIIDLCREVLFPGYFGDAPIDQINLEYYLGQRMTRLYRLISNQISHAVRHDCFRYEKHCLECERLGREAGLRFLKSLPGLRTTLAKDIMAAFEGDPASGSVDEIIFSYPGQYAMTVYRLAHILRKMAIPILPRMMTEYAHSHTGIDIHPGAEIGESFFIDHGTGVVIGESTNIGHRVRIYQGVTLGALSLPPGSGRSMRNLKRHPTIEDDVIIYSGATILGGETVIGARSVIGGNVWLTESVPADTKVFLKTPELVYKGGAEPKGSEEES